MNSIPFRVLRGVASAVAPRRFQKRTAGAIRYEAYRLFGHEPRDDDVFIATYPKSGTTLLQMMLYQLTSDGSMDIPHIGHHVPWFEVTAKHHPDYLSALPSPRCFKSHYHRSRLPREGRFIYVVRNVKDVAISYYHHSVSVMGWAPNFDKFLPKFVQGKVPYGSWFSHLNSWWPHRHAPNTLFLRYEDLVGDLPGSTRRVAAFCNLEVRDDTLARAVERCRFDFMKKHAEKFNPQTFVFRRSPARTTPFIRRGIVDGWREQSADWSLVDSQFEKLALGAEISTLNPSS